MFSSIQVGLAAATGDRIVVLPADMPFVAPATVAALMMACDGAQAAVVPVHAARRGHPIVLAGRLREGLLSADPVSSLKEALTARAVVIGELPVDDEEVLHDVDRPEDLERGLP
jgi:molybdenum cofactor cytidylyltransferase